MHMLGRMSGRSLRRFKASAGVAQSLLSFPGDWDYLGAVRLPTGASVGDTNPRYTVGMAFRRDETDATDPRHLLVQFKEPSPRYRIVEFRAGTPTIPETDVGDPASYPACTAVANYERQPYVDSEETDHMPGDQLDGSVGLCWDHTNDRLIFCNNEGYNSIGQRGWATLDSGAATAQAQAGGIQLSGQGPKAAGTGCLEVPQAFADLYLGGGEWVAFGWGGYYSIIAAADCSMGPSLTFVKKSDLYSTASDGTVANTPGLGYWPWADAPSATRNRCDRFALTESNRCPREPAWGLEKWEHGDGSEGCVLIWDEEKRGLIFFCILTEQMSYLDAAVVGWNHRHYVVTYDPLHLAPVSGTARHIIQPVSMEQWTPPVSTYGTMGSKTITQIASDAAKSKSGEGASEGGCTVTCTGHGRSTGSVVRIRGSQENTYNDIWRVRTVVDADSFTIGNQSIGTNWPGGTNTEEGMTLDYPIPVGTTNLSSDGVGLVTYDPAEKRLYALVNRRWGDNNNSGRALVLVYKRK